MGGAETETQAKQDFRETVLMRWESSSSSVSSSTTLSSSEISDDDDDDETSSSSANSNDHDGPLYQLSDLMTQLPIKRGLSKFYDGKSQTFASLQSVMSVEDLSKTTKFNIQTRRIRRNGNRKMIKYCKSYAGGILELDSSSSSSAAAAAAAAAHKSLAYSPKAIISKKPSNSTSRPFFASFAKRSGATLLTQYPSSSSSSSSFKPSPSMNVLLENI